MDPLRRHFKSAPKPVENLPEALGFLEEEIEITPKRERFGSDSSGSGSATVPVALAGVSPASLRRVRPWPMSEQRRAGTVFGETPKTAVVTAALPNAIESFS